MALADELRQAYAERRTDVVPPSARPGGLDLDAAYTVERELTRRRTAAGARPVGLKVGFANKALWRVLKLDTLVWAHMYDDTVQLTESGSGTLSLAQMCAPKIEPEIVFKLKRPIAPHTADPCAVLESVEWLAPGFEIIDCVYADWKFQPADFVAAYGLHAALVVGTPLVVVADRIPALAEALARFTIALSRDGARVEEGAGRNSLRSPALCLGELATALARRDSADALAGGDLVSSGTLTESQLVASDQVWTTEVDGLDLSALTLHVTT